MHIVALAVLAMVLGLVYQFAVGKLSGYIPQNTITTNKFGAAAVTGLFILLSFFVAHFILGMVGLGSKHHRGA
jgi:hypothetical protein